jgi:hypothetical protein
MAYACTQSLFDALAKREDELTPRCPIHHVKMRESLVETAAGDVQEVWTCQLTAVPCPITIPIRLYELSQ